MSMIGNSFSSSRGALGVTRLLFRQIESAYLALRKALHSGRFVEARLVLDFIPFLVLLPPRLLVQPIDSRCDLQHHVHHRADLIPRVAEATLPTVFYFEAM